MKIEAMVSFCGVLSMSKGEIRDYSVEPVVSDLMEAGYIREISEKTAEKTKPDLQKTRTTRKTVKKCVLHRSEGCSVMKTVKK